MHSQLSRPRLALATVLAVVAALVLAIAGAARANVAFPSPGAMTVAGLPAQLRAGHTFTLREVMPLAVWHGRIGLQRQLPSGVWRTLATAPISPRVFWLHWFVPARWAGSQISVRFVLASRSQLLARSPVYTVSVGG
jgi:hypothetical protein